MAPPDTASAGLETIAGLIGDRSRLAILVALSDGTSRPAGELARAAHISAATASRHLARLTDAGLLSVHSQGRHRYYRVTGAEVVAVVESLAVLARPARVMSLRQSRAAEALADARTCYSHLAGRAGVRMRERLLAEGLLAARAGGGYEVTETGRAVLTSFGLPAAAVAECSSPAANDCIDATERRPHLVGPLPQALLRRLLETGAVRPVGSGRALRVDLERNDDICLTLLR